MRAAVRRGRGGGRRRGLGDEKVCAPHPGTHSAAAAARSVGFAGPPIVFLSSWLEAEGRTPVFSPCPMTPAEMEAWPGLRHPGPGKPCRGLCNPRLTRGLTRAGPGSDVVPVPAFVWGQLWGRAPGPPTSCLICGPLASNLPALAASPTHSPALKESNGPPTTVYTLAQFP